ncbi:hypothetical protein, partial [Endozoicomonas sp. ALB122]
MLPLPPATIGRSDFQSLAIDPNHKAEADRSAKRYFGDPEATGVPDTRSLAKRKCCSPVQDQADH